MEINDRIFGVLIEVENMVVSYGFESDKDMRMSSPSKGSKELDKNEVPNVISNEHMKQMGLDPGDDREFLNELIRFYDFNLVVI